jgi:hypothetical protein
MAIAGMTLTAGCVMGLVGLKMPKGRRVNYCMGGLGLGALGAALFVWSLTLIGPY